MSDHHHTNGNFFNGLFWGALIGGGIVYFLGSQRGKELAEELKEKGLSLIDDFDELFNELEEDTLEPLTHPTTDAISLKTKTHEESPSNQLPQTDVQRVNNFSTVRVEQTEASPTERTQSYVPTHIETLQSHGRRLFSGIPKRR